ncbi:hypothetical protein FDK38_003072 [Candidozyma auris]|nr:hypothetical protein FDK38_003072 [[Candida] auris]
MSSMNATLSFEPEHRKGVAGSGIDPEKMEDWSKHHEHDEYVFVKSDDKVEDDVDESLSSVASDEEDVESICTSRQKKSPSRCRGDSPKRLKQASDVYLSDVEDDDVEEISQEGVVEVSDCESVRSFHSVDGTLIEESKDTIDVDVGAVAAMVGGLACALFYAWRGKGQNAKESMKIFSRGFESVCDKL